MLSAGTGVSRSASSFFGAFTRVEAGHVVIGPAGNGRSRHRSEAGETARFGPFAPIIDRTVAGTLNRGSGQGQPAASRRKRCLALGVRLHPASGGKADYLRSGSASALIRWPPALCPLPALVSPAGNG